MFTDVAQFLLWLASTNHAAATIRNHRTGLARFVRWCAVGGGRCGRAGCGQAGAGRELSPFSVPCPGPGWGGAAMVHPGGAPWRGEGLPAVGPPSGSAWVRSECDPGTPAPPLHSAPQRPERPRGRGRAPAGAPLDIDRSPRPGDAGAVLLDRPSPGRGRSPVGGRCRHQSRRSPGAVRQGAARPGDTDWPARGPLGGAVPPAGPAASGPRAGSRSPVSDLSRTRLRAEPADGTGEWLPSPSGLSQPRELSSLSPHRGDPPARRWRGRPGGAGDTRPPQLDHHRSLHPRVDPAAAGCPRPRPSRRSFGPAVEAGSK